MQCAKRNVNEPMGLSVNDEKMEENKSRPDRSNPYHFVGIFQTDGNAYFEIVAIPGSGRSTEKSKNEEYSQIVTPQTAEIIDSN